MTQLMIGALGGGTVGVVFFGGLWLSVRRVHDRHRPVFWLLASFAARCAVFLAGAYLAAAHWPSLAGYLGGFLLARLTVVPAIDRAAARRRPTEPLPEETAT